MENGVLYFTTLIVLALSMLSMAQVLQVRLNRQLISYSKGLLRLSHHEKTIEQHLIAHGIRVMHASRILHAAQRQYLREIT